MSDTGPMVLWLLYVRCKSGVTFIWRSFRDEIVVNTNKSVKKLLLIVAYDIQSNLRCATTVVDLIFAMKCAILMTSLKFTSTSFLNVVAALLLRLFLIFQLI